MNGCFKVTVTALDYSTQPVVASSGDRNGKNTVIMRLTVQSRAWGFCQLGIHHKIQQVMYLDEHKAFRGTCDF